MWLNDEEHGLGQVLKAGLRKNQGVQASRSLHRPMKSTGSLNKQSTAWKTRRSGVLTSGIFYLLQTDTVGYLIVV